MDTPTTTLGSIILSGSTLWTFLAVVAIVFMIVSLVMHYHWTSYSNRNKTIRRATRAYYIVSIILLALAAIVVVTL